MPPSEDSFLAVCLHPSITDVQFSPLYKVILPVQRHQYGKSHIQRLAIYSAQAEFIGLNDLLRLPHSLKSFTFHGKSRNSGDRRYFLGRFKRAVGHSAKSLEYLNVRWSGGKSFDDGPTVWSFRQFTCIKSLFINHFFLYGLDPETAPCIADSLPSTLEGLVVYDSGDWDKSVFIELWRKLLVKKSSTCLRNLQLVGHEPDRNLLDALVNLAASRGIRADKFQVVCILASLSASAPIQREFQP
ncbi:681_t:CDS:2, partial [Acaulospora colombiana]